MVDFLQIHFIGADANMLKSSAKIQSFCHFSSKSILETFCPNLICSALGGRKVFRSFLRHEYSEENILFWLACEDLKKERSPEMIEEKARVIYEDYVSILSPREVGSSFSHYT